MPKNIMVNEWAARGGISAIHGGSMGAWLMAYVRARAMDITQKRKKYAAWRMRMEGDDSERWRRYKWKRYNTWVKKGYQPVRPKARESWCSALIQQRKEAHVLGPRTVSFRLVHF